MGAQRCTGCREEGHNAAKCPRLVGKKYRRVRLVVLNIAAERRARGVTVEQWRAAPQAPATRGDCVDLPRPCAALRCRYHNGLHGAQSCALDLADRGGMLLDEIAVELDVTKERVRQIEASALQKARNAL